MKKLKNKKTFFCFSHKKAKKNLKPKTFKIFLISKTHKLKNIIIFERIYSTLNNNHKRKYNHFALFIILCFLPHHHPTIPSHPSSS